MPSRIGAGEVAGNRDPPPRRCGSRRCFGARVRCFPMFNRAFAHRAINLTSDTWKRFYSRRASRYVFAMPRSPTSLQWLMRADEARSRADEMDDDESKLAMLEIAA